MGLAPPGDAGSWQIECKVIFFPQTFSVINILNTFWMISYQGYQFWAITDEAGYFSIDNVRPGEYNLYAWVPGFIGDYHNNIVVSVTSGKLVLSNTIISYNISQFLMVITTQGARLKWVISSMNLQEMDLPCGRSASLTEKLRSSLSQILIPYLLTEF